MKKIFSILAVALVAFSFSSCKNEPSAPTVKLNFSGEYVQWDDKVAEKGWWQVMAQDTTYFLTLSNGNEIQQAAGTYTVADLDPKYSYVGIIATEEEVAFTEGSFTVEVAGKQVKITGKLTGADSTIYEINVLYIEPEVKKTVELTIEEAALYDGYADYGLYAFYGANDDAYVQIALWADELQGDFTEEDLDNSYLGTLVEDADGEHGVYTAAIAVTPGNEEGVYAVAADLLCRNNTLYKVNMTVVPGETDGAPAKAPAKKGFKAFKGAKAL